MSSEKIFQFLSLISVGLKKEDAKNRARWRVGVREIAGRVGESGHPRLRG